MKIELKNIKQYFEGNIILDNLDLIIPEGKISCLLGRSGSGKTTILRIIAGIINDFSGIVKINDNDAANLSPKDRRIGWVPQQQLLFPSLNVRDNIAYGLIAKKVAKEEQDRIVDEISKLVGLSHLLDRKTERLSGGERQRVAIARALASSPQILLLDEPFSSLDAPERDRLALALREIQLKTGITTIHVTHSSREAEIISDCVFILSQGKILQEGNTQEIFSNPNSIEVAKLLSIANVVDGGTLKNLSHDAIIPIDAIKIGHGPISAKVLTVTRDQIHLVFDNIRLETKREGNENVSAGDDILISIELESVIYFK
jgi:ABC-type Fe3+/spermidine/putrescine transport system ATPase subunit